MSTPILIIGSDTWKCAQTMHPYMQRAGYNVCSLPSDFTKCTPNVYALTKVEC